MDVIRDVEGVEFLHGGLYEAAHKLLERLYEKTSGNNSYAMDETVERQNGKMLNNHFIPNKNNKALRKTVASRMQCHMIAA